MIIKQPIDLDKVEPISAHIPLKFSLLQYQVLEEYDSTFQNISHLRRRKP
jgi:hypothetical protein